MHLIMPVSTLERADHVAVFCGDRGTPHAADALVLPNWSAADWDNLFARTRASSFHGSEVVIRRDAMDRYLAFVAAGSLEVGITQVDGVTIAPLAYIGAGSVIGEQSFFDGLPRSANVWAVTDGELLTLEFDDYKRFAHEEPMLARDLLFSVARVLSVRLRNTTFRVRR